MITMTSITIIIIINITIITTIISTNIISTNIISVTIITTSIIIIQTLDYSPAKSYLEGTRAILHDPSWIDRNPLLSFMATCLGFLELWFGNVWRFSTRQKSIRHHQ